MGGRDSTRRRAVETDVDAWRGKGRRRARWAGSAEATDRCIGELCHDLRQPIAAISALVALAEQGGDLPDWARRRLRQIGAENAFLADLVREAADGLDQRRPVDLARLVTDVVTAAAADYDGVISAHCPVPVSLDGERVSLRRAIANLVHNAKRAAGPAGHVVVSLQRCAAEAVVTVDDDGPGFGGDVPAGSMLGLRIVRHVAASHGGRFVVGTSPLGGARVQLVVPVGE